MTTRHDLLRPGTAEVFKGVIHLGMFGLASACLLYNLGSWWARREGHLAVNCGVYTLLAGYEVAQLVRHLNRWDD